MRFDSGYDGNVKMTVYEEEKDVMIDDFTAEPMDFRPVNTFFNCTKNIFKYNLSLYSIRCISKR